MGRLAPVRDQVKAINKRLEILNPLRGQLGLAPLPLQSEPKFPLSGNTTADGNRRHAAALNLRQYRLSLDAQIENARKALAKGEGQAPTMNEFFKADGGTPREFASTGSANRKAAAGAPAPEDDGLNYGALFAAGAGLWLLLRK